MSGLDLLPIEQPKKWGSPQEIYTRLCMIILFHRALYYQHNCSVITDYQYDLMERYLWHLIKQGGIFRSVDDPLVNPGCPHILPRTVHKWVGQYQCDKKLPYGHVLEFGDDWKKYLDSLDMSEAEKI